MVVPRLKNLKEISGTLDSQLFLSTPSFIFFVMREEKQTHHHQTQHAIKRAVRTSHNFAKSIFLNDVRIPLRFGSEVCF